MKAKGATQSDVRKHTFVPFTDRVAAIRIDPVRKVSGHRKLPDAEHGSYFIEALGQWSELNLATNFTNFAEKVTRLSLSLPLIIHNQKEIMDLLLEHAKRIDAHSAEPILDLITHFAHDMGSDFEPYFGTTLTTLIEITENMHGEPDLQLYERVFNCLAYLFKYLARLLTTDLRPTYDLLSTLFGKDHKQRGFVLRFAAESMAFLVRKCSDESLSLILNHIIEDVDRQQNPQYSKSTSILLANTMKGPGSGLHSRARELATALLDSVVQVGTSYIYNFACDVFVQVLHHVRKESSQPLYDAVLNYGKADPSLNFLLLFTFAGLRKGDRVHNWGEIYKKLVGLLDNDPVLSVDAVFATAVVLSNASFEATSQYFGQVSSALKDTSSALRVCTLVSELNSDVTQTFIEKLALPKLVSGNALDQCIGLFLLEMDQKVNKKTKFNAKDLLEVWWKIHVLDDTFTGLLKKLVEVQVESSSRGLQADICGTLLLADPSPANYKLILEHFSHLDPRESLLKGLALALPNKLSESAKKHLVELLLDSTMSWNTAIRSAAVDVCKKLYPSPLLDQCILIDQIPIDVSNSRNLAMHIRNLAKNYSTSGSNYIVDLVVPRYMFGLLTSRFQPIWTAVLEQIPVLSDKNKEIIWELAFKWIKDAPEQQPLYGDDVMEPELPDIHDLDCTFLSKVQQRGRHIWADYEDPETALKIRAANETNVPVPEDLRSLAIKVLAQIPKTAESHGDALTPYILHDAGEETAYKDRVALLELFAKFTKPRKLERFDELYARYLYFLGSRHLPIQKLAIKCVLSDNSSSAAVLRKYRDNLDALTDEARLKDEMTHIVGLKGTGQEHAIHDDDRQIAMPIVVRLLYGRAQIAKSTGGIRATQRHAVLAALHSLEPQYIKLFNELAVEQVEFGSDISSLRRQQGYLSLVQDTIHELQSLMVHALDVVVPALLNIIQVVERIGESEEHIFKSAKQLRQSSTKTLENLFSSIAEQGLWAEYIDRIYETLINPQLVNFGQRNLEQPSALMVLVSTLSGDIGLVGYLRPELAEALVSCITFANVKESVVQLVLGFVDNLLEANSELVQVVVPTVIDHLPSLLEREFSINALSQQVSLLNKLVDRDSDCFSKETRDSLISVALLALNKPTGKVPTTVKATLLDSLSKLLVDESVSEAKIDEAYVNLAKMFRLFSDRRARENLARCYASFGARCPKYQLVGELVVELNSYDQRRLGLPDFDRRLAAFAIINEQKYLELTSMDWLVLVYNMLFFIKDPEELALRNNSSYSLRRFVDALNVAGGEHIAIMNDAVLPAIKLGLRESNEAFRLLYLEVLGHLVHTNKTVESIQDLKNLYVEDDDEVDFFYNVQHIQVHRRRRAVQRLSSVASEGKLSGTSISQILLPIIEHFVAYSGNKDGELNNLADDTISAIGELTKHITWNQFRAIVRRYVSLVVTKPLEIRKNVKLVNAMGIAVENPHFELPKPEKYAEFVANEVVAPLHKVMSQKTNEHENLPERITLAIPIVYFLRSLPKDDLERELPGKLSGLCQILRSKTQELRDAVRETLGRVVKILGPDYFVYIVSELSSALRRGAQLHVLGFTVHSLLLELKDVIVPGDLDASVEGISDIIIEDIFGTTGQEKDSDGYVTSAKEVKQHKSFDTAEILASNINLPQFGLFIQPIKDLLLYTKINLKTERKVSELLQRISNGLHRNAVSKSQQGLVMCFQMYKMCISATERQERENELANGSLPTDRKAILDRAAKESEAFFTVRLSSRHWDETNGARKLYVKQLYLLQTFVLDALRTMLGATELLTVANVKGLLPIVEEAIQSNQEDTQIAALKLATSSLRIAVPGIDDRITSLGRRTLALIKTTSSTTTELCQACLKFLVMLFKHKPDFELKEAGIGYILDRIKPDIEEPDRQGVSIGFTRAILSRKLLLPQLYDMMDQIAKVMVTNQSAMVRTACRSAYLQFLLEYPHGKQRLDKHFAFLVSNLQYPSSNGRLSVMEMIRLVITKVHEEQIEATLTSFFVGLVLVLVNDDEAECRSTASKLIKELLTRVDSDSKTVIIDYCISWLSKLGTNNLLVRGGMEVVAMMGEVGGYLDNQKLRERIDKTVVEVLEGSRRQSGLEVEWQLVYFVLQYVSQQSISLETLKLVEDALLFPHPWVRALAGRIFGSYYTLAKTEGKPLPTELLTEAANRFMRQMGAPSLPEPDGVQIVKNLVYTVTAWESTTPTPTVETKTGEQKCTEWLFNRVSGLLRVDIHNPETVGSKTAAVQLLASLAQVLGAERLKPLAESAILGLYVLTQHLDDDEKTELRDLAQQALTIYDKALGTTEYLHLYNAARQQVQTKRLERRTKRSVEAVTAPATHARKKIKKNILKKESRRRHAKAKRT